MQVTFKKVKTSRASLLQKKTKSGIIASNIRYGYNVPFSIIEPES